jgi:hypothetical protein
MKRILLFVLLVSLGCGTPKPKPTLPPAGSAQSILIRPSVVTVTAGQDTQLMLLAYTTDTAGNTQLISEDSLATWSSSDSAVANVVTCSAGSCTIDSALVSQSGGYVESYAGSSGTVTITAVLPGQYTMTGQAFTTTATVTVLP